MGIQVYANGMSIACKAADGKSAAASPDVCMSPPTPPGVPVPVPYPNTAMASDTTDGSKTVQINGQEVMLKDKSTFKTSTGNEAATKTLGMGVVTHQIQGEASFVAWSMDVKFEGENVPRHMDLMGHNEGSDPPNTPPWAYFDSMSSSQKADCKNDKEKEEAACGYDKETGKYTLTAQECCDNVKCQDARKCMLVPYRHQRKKTCCPGQSGHHLIEVHSFCKRRKKPMAPFDGTNGKKRYSKKKAPCVCATSPNSNWEGEHGDLHCVQGIKENYAIMTASERNPPRTQDRAWTYGEARQAGVDAHAATFPKSECATACIAAQLDAYHKEEIGADDSTPLRTKKYGFGDKLVDQLKRGVRLIRALANSRIGDIAPGMIAE